MSEDPNLVKARETLDLIIHDLPVWEAAMGLLFARSVRQDLVQWRLRKGLSVEELAERMDISSKALRKMERQVYPDLRLSTLRRWHMALGLQTEYAVTPLLEEE